MCYLSTYTLYREEDEEFLEQWIKNALQISDEIIIIDGTSSLSINSPKIKIVGFTQQHERYSKEWMQSDQRNLALSLCKGRWILQLDIDENIDCEARQVLAKNDYKYPHINGYGVATLNFWESMEYIRVDQNFYPDGHYRFIKNFEGIRYSRGSRHLSLNLKPDIRGFTKLPRNNPVFLSEFCTHIKHYKYLTPRLYNGVYRLNRKEVKTLDEYYQGVTVLSVNALQEALEELKASEV